MTEEKLSLLSLDVQNVLRLKAVKLTMAPDGALVIEGKNEQGKSSVLRALEILLAGGKEMPADPLHGDAEKGHIIASFDDIVVKKVFKKGKRPALTITKADGARIQAPQTMLDKLLSHVTLDPVKFMNMDDKEKTAVLSDIMGFDSADFDAEIERVYNQRRDANREAKRLQAVAEATTFHEDAPDEEVSVSALMAELKTRQEHNQARANKQMELEKARILLGDIKKTGEEHRKAYESTEREIAELQTRLAHLADNITAAEKDYASQEAVVLELLGEATDMSEQKTDDITQAISEADDVNAKVRENIEREKAINAAKAAQAEADALDKQLEEAKAEREKARLAARDRLPIPDLDITSDAVLYKGKPLSQAGASAELRVSVAVAMALNKNKRVKLLLIDDAEKLDADNVKVVMEMAREAGFQVIMARVGSGEEASVVIEDGEIRA